MRALDTSQGKLRREGTPILTTSFDPDLRGSSFPFFSDAYDSPGSLEDRDRQKVAFVCPG